jgi:hypothetical protein
MESVTHGHSETEQSTSMVTTDYTTALPADDGKTSDSSVSLSNVENSAQMAGMPNDLRSEPADSHGVKRKHDVMISSDTILKLIQCPVCMHVPPRGPINSCANGHLVCSACLYKHGSKTPCAVCRDGRGGDFAR